MTDGSIRYLVCTIPRSGSNFLCDLLRRTDQLGMRECATTGYEHILQLVRSGFGGVDWSITTPVALFDAAFIQSATPNGVMGFKVMWNDFRQVLERTGRPRLWQRQRAEGVERELASKTRFIWLRRRDAERQAISWTKALQDRVWTLSDQQGFEGRYSYDYLWIATMLRKIRSHDRQWSAFFNRVGIKPLTLYYEDFIGDVPGTIREIANYLGVAVPLPAETSNRGSYRQQSDAVNEEWLARYQRDGKGTLRRSLALARCALAARTWRRLLRPAVF